MKALSAFAVGALVLLVASFASAEPAKAADFGVRVGSSGFALEVRHYDDYGYHYRHRKCWSKWYRRHYPHRCYHWWRDRHRIGHHHRWRWRHSHHDYWYWHRRHYPHCRDRRPFHDHDYDYDDDHDYDRY